MSWTESIKESLPDYAKDIRLNIDAVLLRSSLDPALAHGCASAAAFAAGNSRLLTLIDAAIDDRKEADAALTAATIMAQNNVWYPYVEMVNDPALKGLPAGLRMNGIMSHGGTTKKNFDAAVNGVNDVFLIEELANSQFTLVEHLSGKSSSKQLQESNELANIIRSQDEQIRFLSYKILIERFNEKYKGLDESQRKLLQEYIYNTTNTSKLKSYTQVESRRLAKEITQRLGKISDTVVRIKLTEVVSQLKKVEKAAVIKENHMTAMLIGYEILKELKTL